jgi:hypothetical protein
MDARSIISVSRQTVLQLVKRGGLQVVHVWRGRRRGLRIKVTKVVPGLFDQSPAEGGVV